jgi:starch synthase (maltosyl-transferring)
LPSSSSSRNNASAPARVVIESVRPEVDCGRYPVKRVAGEEVAVEADVFADGHDAVVAEVLFKHEEEEGWKSVPMDFRHNDHWAASFRVEKLGRYQYTVRGWSDPFLTWQRDLKKRQDAGQDITIDLQIGSQLLGREIGNYESAMAAQSPPPAPERIAEYGRVLEVVVDPVRARYSTWYEMFPRSSRSDGEHGSFRDVVKLLPYVAEMGFDVLYLPPIHPIGTTARKGRNNAVSAERGDVGSPWAIGAKEGGHKAIHPQLGTMDDFEVLVREAGRKNIQIALDIAFQCSPDHPYVKEHPQWFRWRPDGTVQYAENPPKKYQDIYPFEFESPEWQSLWEELKSVFEFWAAHGVRIFRVDNPHTKPFAFWEWAIAELKKRNPELIFLSEAFTRPRIMHRLAKLGFTQSYTYFTWRNAKHELMEYFTELSQHPSREYFRPNCWPNTPDILHAYLQHGGRPAFIVRLVLAGTLAANYGMYGPAFELCENAPREPDSEEYLFSEKYEVKRWARGRADSLKDLISRLNRVRRENAALQSDWSLRFHPVDNGQMIAYSKSEGENHILAVVNLDPHHVHSGWVEFGAPGDVFELHDLLSGGRYTWSGGRNYVELNPHTLPAHVFRVHRRPHP